MVKPEDMSETAPSLESCSLTVVEMSGFIPQTETITDNHLRDQSATQNPSSSDHQIREWDSKVGAWLSTLPQQSGSVAESDIEAWLSSNQVPLPELLQSLPREQLYERVLSIHRFMQQIDQVKEDNLNEPARAARFQRTDQWIPVYSWLESLDKNEVVKSKEISDWLSKNPDIKEKLYSRHSRYHLMHYIQKCHLKILKRRGKLQKPSGPVSGEMLQTQGTQPSTTSVPEKGLNDGMATPADLVPGNSPSNLLQDNDISVAKRNEAFRRYQLFTELEKHLGNLLSNSNYTTT